MSDRYRVLLVDDTVALRRLVRGLLEDSGRFEIIGEAGTGVEAVELAGALQPDLAVLDLAMPVMDGLEALPEIRRCAPQCVVVVLSGFDGARMASIAVERGAGAYLAKGVPPRRLIAELLAVVEPANGQTGGRRACKRFPVDLSSPTEARRFAVAVLDEWAMGAIRDDAGLLVSEVVTNAIVHAESPAELTMSVEGDLVRFVVRDWGGGALTLRNPTATTPDGRGLRIVDRLSQDWGTSTSPNGKLVWFSIAAP
jgi:CheY-like chemotaxis protein/anti-sigma regulatory factor (Ser/Thr protein kinase)